MGRCAVPFEDETVDGPVVVRCLPPLLLAIVGCAQPLYNGPSFLNSRNPEVDRRRFERYDPLPAEDIAPETYARPRGYEGQRSLPRRVNESRQLLGVPADTPAPRVPSAQYEYPGVVHN